MLTPLTSTAFNEFSIKRENNIGNIIINETKPDFNNDNKWERFGSIEAEENLIFGHGFFIRTDIDNLNNKDFTIHFAFKMNCHSVKNSCGFSIIFDNVLKDNHPNPQKSDNCNTKHVFVDYPIFSTKSNKITKKNKLSCCKLQIKHTDGKLSIILNDKSLISENRKIFGTFGIRIWGKIKLEIHELKLNHID